MTVAELGRRMSSAEFAEWLAYSELEPFGPLADAAAAAWFANVNRDPKKRPEAYAAAEVLQAFAFDPPTPEQLRAAQINSTLARLLSLGAGPRKPRTVTRKPRSG